jgi:hypothetical protein
MGHPIASVAVVFGAVLSAANSIHLGGYALLHNVFAEMLKSINTFALEPTAWLDDLLHFFVVAAVVSPLE